MPTDYPYTYTMASAFDEAPEVAPQSYPEVAPQHEVHQYAAGVPYDPRAQAPLKQESTAAYPGYGQVDPAVYGVTAVASPYTPVAEPLRAPERRAGPTVCGCSLLVFVLSAVIASLAAAVIGLAAGTGVEAHRASNADDMVSQLSASLAAATASVTTATVTVSGLSATATSFSSIDNNCSSNPDGVTGQTYSSFSLLGGQTFTMHCNKDAQSSPLLSLFTADFNTCMDACSGYNKYEPLMFGSNKNTTCAAVSFIPLWTLKANATAGGAPGNCYLKPGPQNSSTLASPQIGTECHAAVLDQSS